MKAHRLSVLATTTLCISVAASIGGCRSQHAVATTSMMTTDSVETVATLDRHADMFADIRDLSLEFDTLGIIIRHDTPGEVRQMQLKGVKVTARGQNTKVQARNATSATSGSTHRATHTAGSATSKSKHESRAPQWGWLIVCATALYLLLNRWRRGG